MIASNRKLLAVGTKVKLLTQKYAESHNNPTQTVGTVVKSGRNTEFPYFVNWSSGGSNTYQVDDIAPIDPLLSFYEQSTSIMNYQERSVDEIIQKGIIEGKW